MSEEFDVKEDYTTWCRSNAESLRKYIRRITREHQAADDAVQVVLFRFWRRWQDASFRTRAREEPGYARRAVINAWRSECRSDRAREMRQQRWVSDNPGRESHEMYSDVEREVRLAALLQPLPPTWRTVIELRHIQGKSFVQVAAEMGIAEWRARHYDALAIRALRKAAEHE